MCNTQVDQYSSLTCRTILFTELTTKSADKVEYYVHLTVSKYICCVLRTRFVKDQKG